MRAIGFFLLAITALATVVQVFWLAAKLPDPVASHFGPNGQPDGWMSRSGFLIMHFLLQLGMAAFMVGIAYGLKWLPSSMLNIPNKEYWMHEDRRDEAFRKSASMMIFIAGLTGVFLAVVFQFVFVANAGGAPLPIPVVLTAVAAYMVVVIGMAVRSMWSFRLPDDEQISGDSN